MLCSMGIRKLKKRARDTISSDLAQDERKSKIKARLMIFMGVWNEKENKYNLKSKKLISLLFFEKIKFLNYTNTLRNNLLGIT